RAARDSERTPAPPAPRLGAAAGGSWRVSFEAAFGLGAVDAQRIQFRELMQEAARRRRYRDQRARVGEHDRLPHLAVPRTKAERRPFIAAKLELVAAHEGHELVGLDRLRPRRRLADRARSEP